MEKRYIVVRIDLYTDEVLHFIDKSTRREAKRIVQNSLAWPKANNVNPYKFVYEIKTIYANKP